MHRRNFDATWWATFTRRPLRAALVAASCAASLSAQSPPACPGLLYQTGFDGGVLAGDKASLAAAVERGEAIRVGWSLDFDADGTTDLAHWAESGFLTVFEGEVFAQLEAIAPQRPVARTASVTLVSGPVTWRGLLGSDGSLAGAFSDGRPIPGGARVAIRWCSTAREPDSDPQIVYVNSMEGTAEQGSVAALIDAIRAGRSVQVGWGFEITARERRYQVEHVAAPVFTSIIDGTQVVVQLPEHIAQRSYVDEATARFDSASVMWRGLLSTSGAFDAVLVDRATGVVVRRIPQRARMVWFVGRATGSGGAPLSTPNGVRLESSRSAPPR